MSPMNKYMNQQLNDESSESQTKFISTRMYDMYIYMYIYIYMYMYMYMCMYMYMYIYIYMYMYMNKSYT